MGDDSAASELGVSPDSRKHAILTHMRKQDCEPKPSCRSRRAPETLSDLSMTGPGVGPLLAMAAVIVPPTLSDLLANRVFMAGFLAWFLAQFGKVSSFKKMRGHGDL